MSTLFNNNNFETINNAYKQTFVANKLSIGLVVPIENYLYNVKPTMHEHIQIVQLVEQLGFKALWLRDIPFDIPSFGDVGQMFDPFVYLGLLSGKTSKIALGVGSMILPLQHPAHIAKAAASIDVLSEGRLILGIASGDRPQEYPALNINYEKRGQGFRKSVEYIQAVWKKDPLFQNDFGFLDGNIDMLPKPTSKKVPMLITGASQQDSKYLANNGNGWITYPRLVRQQANFIDMCRNSAKKAGSYNKPVSQSLYIDLDENHTLEPQVIHLGYRLNTIQLIKHLKSLEKIGVNHVALNLRFNQADRIKTLKHLAQEVLPVFH